MIARSVRDMWWPLFAFGYPLLALPGQHDFGPAFTVRMYFTIVFVVGGIVLELTDPARSAVHLRAVFRRSLWRHPPIVLALAFAVWVVFAAAFAPNRAIAYTGAFVSLADGAVWMVAMVAVFVLVYMRTLSSPLVARNVTVAIMLSGAVLVSGGLFELVLGHGLVYPATSSELPMVTFPQKGHLAGMLAMAGGIAATLAPITAAGFLALGIGTTLNRSAAAAVLVVGLVIAAMAASHRTRAAIGLLLVFGMLVAGTLVTRSLVHPAKDVVSAGTLESRTYYYRAALRGIAARPILGWGGGNFALAWPTFLSPQELDRFGKAEWGYQKVLGATVSDSIPPLLAIRDRAGVYRLSVVRTFKTHDQLLEAALMWGIPGALLYTLLFALGLRGLAWGSPAAAGLLAYGIFLLFWFVIPETQGVWWALLASAYGEALARRSRADPVGST